jgi:hypothetical protein
MFVNNVNLLFHSRISFLFWLMCELTGLLLGVCKPARLIVTGRVYPFDDFTKDFNVLVEQRVQNASQNAIFDVRGAMDSSLIPLAYTVVSFSGTLMTVTPGVAHVAVDNISYIPPQNRRLLTRVNVYV